MSSFLTVLKLSKCNFSPNLITPTSQRTITNLGFPVEKYDLSFDSVILKWVSLIKNKLAEFHQKIVNRQLSDKFYKI